MGYKFIPSLKESCVEDKKTKQAEAEVMPNSSKVEVEVVLEFDVEVEVKMGVEVRVEVGIILLFWVGGWMEWSGWRSRR